MADHLAQGDFGLAECTCFHGYPSDEVGAPQSSHRSVPLGRIIFKSRIIRGHPPSLMWGPPRTMGLLSICGRCTVPLHVTRLIHDVEPMRPIKLLACHCV